MRVAVFGSCVSRDGFELVPEPRVTIVRYIARTSFANLFTAAIPLQLSEVSAPNRFEARCIHGDVTRSSLSVLDVDADYLILDLIDDRFDLVDLGGSLALHTGFFQKSGILERYPERRVIKRLSREAIRRWMSGCDRFADRLRRR